MDDLPGEVGEGEQISSEGDATGAREVWPKGVASAVGRGEPECGADAGSRAGAVALQQGARLARPDRATEEEDGGHPCPALAQAVRQPAFHTTGRCGREGEHRLSDEPDAGDAAAAEADDEAVR